MTKVFSFLLSLLLTSQLHAQFLAQPQENLQNLAADRSQFSAISPIVGGVQTQDGFTRELLRVEWRKGDPIDLYIVRPVNAVKPPVVLFLYSWPGDTEIFRNDAWCRAVTGRGFAGVGLVSALTGHRYHGRPWKEWFVSELPEALVKTVHDVQLTLDYLATRADLDTSREAIFGQGSGGTIALLTATVEPRLKAVDVIDPWGDWPEWFKSSPEVPEELRAQLTDPAFLSKLASLDPVKILPALTGMPLRLQESSLNPSTPVVAKSRIHKAMPDRATYTVYVTEAEYRSRAMNDGKILEWLQTRLLSLEGTTPRFPSSSPT